MSEHKINVCHDCSHIAAYHSAFGCQFGGCPCRATEAWVEQHAPSRSPVNDTIASVLALVIWGQLWMLRISENSLRAVEDQLWPLVRIGRGPA